MSKLFSKPTIEVVDNDGCSETEVEALLDAFTYTIKRIATTRARKAWFELRDYEGANQRGIVDFTLLIERKLVLEQEQFWGNFTAPCKKLTIIVSLCKN